MRARVKADAGSFATKRPDGVLWSPAPGAEIEIDDNDADLVAWAEGFDALEVIEPADPKVTKAAAKAKTETKDTSAAPAESGTADESGEGEASG